MTGRGWSGRLVEYASRQRVVAINSSWPAAVGSGVIRDCVLFSPYLE